MRHNCVRPGCTNDGILRVEEDVWPCAKHMTERVYTPASGALAPSQASEDLDEGGEPS